MATLTIRNLDESLKARLRIRAASHDVSMEEEVRRILDGALWVRYPDGVREEGVEHTPKRGGHLEGAGPKAKTMDDWLVDLARVSRREPGPDPIARTDRNQPDWE